MNKEIQEKIDKYLSNSMTEAEVRSFESEMHSNESLLKLVEQEKEAREWIILAGMSRDFNEITLATQQYEQNQKYTNKLKWIIGATTLLITFSLFYYLFVGEKTIIGNKEVNENINQIKKSKERVKPIFIDSIKKTQNIGSNSKSQKSNIKEIIKDDDIKLDSINEVAPFFKEENLTNVIKDSISLVTKKDTCIGEIFFKVETTPTCRHKNQGEISISYIKGGNEPYSVRLNNRKFEPINKLFFLSEGEHYLEIKDNKGCLSEKKKVRIESKKCTEMKDYVIYLKNEIEWEFPDFEEGNIQFSVFNIAGETVYSIYTIQKSSNFWDGRNNQHVLLNAGTYPYQLMNEKGEVLQKGIFTLVE